MDESKRALMHPCVAHRGFSGIAPENTLAAFKLAMELPHVKWMELDVHLSRDDVPVVIHDGTLKRTTNGRGRVRDLTAEQLGRLDAGSWFNPAYSQEKVPTLDEVMALTAGKCRLNIELKGEDADRDLLAKRAVDVIRAHRREHETVVTSFHKDILLAVRKSASSLKTGLIIDDRPADLVKIVTDMDASYLSIGFQHINGQLLEQCSSASVEVMAWTVNAMSDLRRLARRPEPFQLCTNYPNRWLAAIQEENTINER